MHEVIDEEKTASFWVGGEAYGGDHVATRGGGGGKAEEPRSEEKLVVELALPLEGGGGVHELDGDGFSGEGAGEDGAEAAVAEGGGEVVGGAAEEGVGEPVWGVRVGVGGWSGSLLLPCAVAEAEEHHEDEGACGGGGGQDWG